VDQALFVLLVSVGLLNKGHDKIQFKRFTPLQEFIFIHLFDIPDIFPIVMPFPPRSLPNSLAQQQG
jgi:hypothetical protein